MNQQVRGLECCSRTRAGSGCSAALRELRRHGVDPRRAVWAELDHRQRTAYAHWMASRQRDEEARR